MPQNDCTLFLFQARWAFSDNVTGRDIKVRSREKCQIDGMIIHVVDLFSVDETVDVNSEVLVKGWQRTVFK